MLKEEEGKSLETSTAVERGPDALGGYAADLSDTDNTIEDDEQAPEGEILEPFDPTKVRVVRSNPTINLMQSRLENDEIDLAPDFQRKSGLWSATNKSRLIESLLIRLPLPAFYVDASNESKWVVVDGLQRFTILKEYIVHNAFSLGGLEFLKDLEGLTYDQLPRMLQRRIAETEVTVFAIQAGTPDEVKFNIFKRINTGGLPLSSQEIRNALNGKRVRAFLNGLAESKEFLTATNGRIKDTRMADKEIVLRFIAFKVKGPRQYSRGHQGSFDSFLNNTMKALNDPTVTSDQNLKELRKHFLCAMQTCHQLFGSHAFRKYYGPDHRLQPINKALFEAWAVNVSNLKPASQKLLVEAKENVLAQARKLFYTDQEFVDSISRSTNSPTAVETRFRRVHELVSRTLKAAK